MPQITISKAATDKIKNDPGFQQSRADKINPKVPLLYYYQRSYSTSHDGIKVEHGDGFMLSFVDPKEIKASKDIAYETANIADGINVMIGAPPLILSHSLNIGWSGVKFTLESQLS